MFMTRHFALAAAVAVLAGMSTQAQVQTKPAVKAQVKAQAPAATAPAATGALKWKFKEGEKLQYLLDQQSVSALSVNGQMIENKVNQTFDMTWTIKKVMPDGSAEMTQTFDRVRFKTEGLLGEVAFDSKDAKEPEGPAAALAQVFRTLVGNDASLTMTALGEIKDLKLPEKAVEALKNSPPGPGGQRTMSEESFKNIIQQSALVLPGKPLAANGTWTEKREMPQPPLGSMAVNTTYTFKGADAQNKALDRIDLKSTMELKVNPDFPVMVTLKEQDVKGAISFDREAGHVTTSKTEQKLKLILETMGQEIEQETNTTIAITLQDGASPK